MAGDRETVIVTGAGGMIGSPVCERMNEEYRVVALDRPGPPHPPHGVDMVPFDVTDEDGVRRAMEHVRREYGDRIASVVHLAAYYNFSGEASPLYEEVTVRGTARLLRHLRDFRVEQFVFSSTMLVHAPARPGVRITEDSPVAPTWDYPASKVRTEELIRKERGGIPAVFLRIAGVYDDECHSIPLAHQIQRIFEKRLTSHVYPADPARGQAFVHLEDVIDVFPRVIARRAELPPEAAFLVGEPETLSYGELQRMFGRLIHGKEWGTYRVPQLVAKAGAWVQNRLPGGAFIKPWMIERAGDHYALDVSRAAGQLGWEPRHSLRDTLPRMVERLKADPVGWYHENKLEPPAAVRKMAGATA